MEEETVVENRAQKTSMTTILRSLQGKSQSLKDIHNTWTAARVGPSRDIDPSKKWFNIQHICARI